jgi:hypothetical protein
MLVADRYLPLLESDGGIEMDVRKILATALTALALGIGGLSVVAASSGAAASVVAAGHIAPNATHIEP